MEYTREWAEQTLKAYKYRGPGPSLHDYLFTPEDIAEVKVALQIIKALDEGATINRIDVFRHGASNVILVPRLTSRSTTKSNIQIRS